MTSNCKINVDTDDLICPITYQIFRDPVIAGDGHVYERAAIIRWIEEHGTSPLTRQPLNLNELQADDYLRKLAVQRRSSSMSSNHDTNLHHAALQRQCSTISYNYNIYVDQPVIVPQHIIPNNNVALRHNDETRNAPCICQYAFCLFTMITIAFALCIALLSRHFFITEIGDYSESSSTMTTTYSSLVTSTYSSMLTNDSQMSDYSLYMSDTYFYYEAIEVNVSVEGTYSLTSNSSFNIYGYIYYYNFDPFNPKRNLISHDDNDGRNGHFELTVSLRAGLRYILIVRTSVRGSMGKFSIIVSGPASVDLTRTIIRPKTPFRAAHIRVNDRWTQTGVTVAGGNGKGSELDQLNDPYGLYVDDNQTIYIADFGNDRVMEWKPNTMRGQVVAGGNGNGNHDDQLNGPKDVIVDKETDSLIICDSRNEDVVRWPRQGGTNREKIIIDVECTDLTMDDNGFLYVFNHDKKQVRRWQIGKTLGIVVKDNNNKDLYLDFLKYPNYVFVNRHRSLYISNVRNRGILHDIGRVKKAFAFINGRRDFGQSLGNLAQHRGVVVDQLGTAYVADCVTNSIMRWSKGATQGIVIVDGRGKETEPNQLSCPRGLSFDVHGNLYVVDAGNHRVQRFNIISNA